MKISENIESLLNEQVVREYQSAFAYLELSSRLDVLNFNGMSNWMYIQYKEELEHAQKIIKYIQYRSGEFKLGDIKKIPLEDFKKPLNFFKKVYELECEVTQSINNIYQKTREEKDYATENFLKWFIEEQEEEENSALDIVNKLELLGDSSSGLYSLDKTLSKRKEE